MAENEMNKTNEPREGGRNRWTAISLVGFVAVMLALSFAAVPLYRLFCQVTGYGGTTQRAEAVPDKVLDRTIRVRFDANTARGLPWGFHPVVRVIEVKIGESSLAFYQAENLTDKPVTGTASFNVTPEAAGRYFNKIACFCFVEQTLAAGQSMDMPVTFFIDPALVDDDATRNLSEITLSYTFYPSGDSAAPRTAQAGGPVN
jgi:cytochrome c oxidase assembly protein subunit 11